MTRLRFWLSTFLFVTAFSLAPPPSAEAGPCVSGCNQLEIACAFEARSIAEVSKFACVTAKAACTDECSVGIETCLEGCEATRTECLLPCDSLEKRSHKRRCKRTCNRNLPRCQRSCGRGEFLACETSCRLTRRKCVADAARILKASRPFCEADNNECRDTCGAVTDRSCLRDCESSMLRCYKRAKDVKEACFHQCFIDDDSAEDCKSDCRAINVASNDVCTDEALTCFEACD